MKSHGRYLSALLLIGGLVLSALSPRLAAQEKAQPKAEPPYDRELMLKWHFGEFPEGAEDPSTTAVVPVGKMPEPVDMQPPAFPASMREAELEGLVYAKLLIGRDGVPRKGFIMKIEGGNEDMAKAALEAVRKWIFKPALVNGKPVEVWVVVPLKFRLS